MDSPPRSRSVARFWDGVGEFEKQTSELRLAGRYNPGAAVTAKLDFGGGTR